MFKEKYLFDKLRKEGRNLVIEKYRWQKGAEILEDVLLNVVKTQDTQY